MENTYNFLRSVLDLREDSTSQHLELFQQQEVSQEVNNYHQAMPANQNYNRNAMYKRNLINMCMIETYSSVKKAFREARESIALAEARLDRRNLSRRSKEMLAICQELSTVGRSYRIKLRPHPSGNAQLPNTHVYSVNSHHLSNLELFSASLCVFSWDGKFYLGYVPRGPKTGFHVELPDSISPSTDDVYMFHVENVVANIRAIYKVRLGRLSSMSLFPYLDKPALPARKNNLDPNEVVVLGENDLLTEDQRATVHEYVRLESGILSVHGPPGTGKSTAIRQMLLCSKILKRRVLVCCYSNDALQELVIRFGEQNSRLPEPVYFSLIAEESKLTLYDGAARVYTPAKRYEVVFDWIHLACDALCEIRYSLDDYPHLLKPSNHERDRARKLRECIDTLRVRFRKLARAHRKVTENVHPQLLVIRNHNAMKFWLPCYQAIEHIRAAVQARRPVPDDLISSVNRQAHLLRKGLSDLRKEVVMDELSRSSVIFCTLTKSATSDIRRVEPPMDTVIIDEAGQAPEFHAILPLTAMTKRLVLVGDAQQLPPQVSTEVARRQFDRSLLERMEVQDSPDCMYLRVQFRMEPEIREWPSAYFYDGTLIDSPTIATRPSCNRPQRVQPFQVLNIPFGKEESSYNNSKFNELEAEMVVRRVLFLVLHKGFQQKSIGVITFYRAQLVLIKRLLVDTNMPNVRVATVDSFQGQEVDVVLVSFVRANPDGVTGFLKECRRLNVALTRARFVLEILCHMTTFDKENGEDSARSLLEHARMRNQIVTVQSPRPRNGSNTGTMFTGHRFNTWKYVSAFRWGPSGIVNRNRAPQQGQP